MSRSVALRVPSGAILRTLRRSCDLIGILSSKSDSKPPFVVERSTLGFEAVSKRVEISGCEQSSEGLHATAACHTKAIAHVTGIVY